MSKLPEKIRLAFEEVRKHHPQVCMVVYSQDGRWLFMDADLNSPIFRTQVDVGLLEDAQEYAEKHYALPVAFQYRLPYAMTPLADRLLDVDTTLQTLGADTGESVTEDLLTLGEAGEALEILAQMTAAMENTLLHANNSLTVSDVATRTELVEKAKALLKERK